MKNKRHEQNQKYFCWNIRFGRVIFAVNPSLIPTSGRLVTLSISLALSLSRHEPIPIPVRDGSVSRKKAGGMGIKTMNKETRGGGGGGSLLFQKRWEMIRRACGCQFAGHRIINKISLPHTHPSSPTPPFTYTYTRSRTRSLSVYTHHHRSYSAAVSSVEFISASTRPAEIRQLEACLEEKTRG